MRMKCYAMNVAQIAEWKLSHIDNAVFVSGRKDPGFVDKTVISSKPFPTGNIMDWC